jgi:hypothetical protein
MVAYGSLIINDGASDESSFGVSSLSVSLSCSFVPAGISYSKKINRIASSKNPMKAAKSIISEYAGCDEASIVRKRAIALSRIRLSISGEEFRFRLP